MANDAVVIGLALYVGDHGSIPTTEQNVEKVLFPAAINSEN